MLVLLGQWRVLGAVVGGQEAGAKGRGQQTVAPGPNLHITLLVYVCTNALGTAFTFLNG